MTPNQRAMVTIEADTTADLEDAIALLKLGAGPLLTGRISSPEEDSGIAFAGQLAIGQLPNVTPFLLALIRHLLLGEPTERNVARIAGRIWLASHCAICGAAVEEGKQSTLGDALCTDCELLNSRENGIGRLARMEQIRLDQATIMAFLKDPRASDSDRDQFYMLMMARELENCARDGYQKHGRGALILDQTGGADSFRAFYIDQATAQNSGVGWPSSSAEKMVHEYDPAAEMIVVFLRPGNIPVTYRMAFDNENWFNPGDRGGQSNPFRAKGGKASAA